MPTDFGDIGALESVRTAIAAAAEIAATSARQSVVGNLQYMLEHKAFESPIEAIFFAHFEGVASANGGGLSLSPQAQLKVGDKNYRADFIVEPNDTDMSYEMYLYGLGSLKVVIELDGHDFHEKTKEQVALRNQRDRDLQAEGWKVLHYSGSELHKNPQRAALDAYSLAWREWTELMWALRKVKVPVHAELGKKTQR